MTIKEIIKKIFGKKEERVEDYYYIPLNLPGIEIPEGFTVTLVNNEFIVTNGN